MRIINNPNPVQEQVHTCEKCKCEFAFTEADINVSSYNDGILGTGCHGYIKHFVKCPNCGEVYYTYDSTMYKNYTNSVTLNVKDMKSLDPEISKMVDDEFWNLV